MKKSIVEVRAELSGCTVEMLRNIVRKDSTVKGVFRMRKAELVEAAVKVVSKLNPEVVEQSDEANVADAKAQTKVTHSRYDFSACKDEEKLRKVLNKASKEIVLHIARTFEQIQLPADGKGVTKEELVDAIVCLYFPKAPASPATTEAPTPQRPVRHTFTPGKRYFTCRFRHDVCIPERLFEVTHRTKNAVTVIELDVNDKDFVIAGPLTKPIHSAHGYEYFNLKKFERVCAYHRYDIEFGSDVDYDAAFDEAAYSPDYQENRAVLDDEPLESEPQATTKEEQTMRLTKMAVLDAVEALRKAETPGAMHEILMRCKKADMVSALSVLTDGAKYVRAAQSNNETARRVITELQDWREEEAFRALSYEEKYAALFDADGAKVRMYVQLMSDAEITETASRLDVQIPVNVGEYFPYSMNLEAKVEYMMKALREAKAIKSVGSPAKADDLWYRLNRASDLSLAIMVREVGLEVEVRCSCYNTEAKDAIFKHYATDEHRCVYEPESSEEGYSDRAGDNASPDADIEIDGATLCEDLPEESESAEVDDAVWNAIRIIGSDAGYVEKHDALTKCSDPGMFAVMSACTGRLKLSSDYDSHEALAWIVLLEIEKYRTVKEVMLDVAI